LLPAGSVSWQKACVNLSPKANQLTSRTPRDKRNLKPSTAGDRTIYIVPITGAIDLAGSVPQHRPSANTGPKSYAWILPGGALRREARRAEPVSSQPARSPEALHMQEQGTGEALAEAPPAQTRPAARHFAALKTRSGPQHVWLLKEILGPPLALRDPYNDDGR
jgi:hypothetical protein